MRRWATEAAEKIHGERQPHKAQHQQRDNSKEKDRERNELVHLAGDKKVALSLQSVAKRHHLGDLLELLAERSGGAPLSRRLRVRHELTKALGLQDKAARHVSRGTTTHNRA